MRKESLSSKIEKLIKKHHVKTFGKLVEELETESIAITLIVLSLPSALPIPATGYSTFFGVIFVTIALSQLFNKKLSFINNKKIDKGFYKLLITKGIKFLRFLEKFTKPRMSFLFKSRLFVKLIWIIILLCGLSMILPIPFTNTAPAFSILIIALSLIEKDGLIAILGILSSIIALIISITVIILFITLGYHGIIMFKQMLFSVLK